MSAGRGTRIAQQDYCKSAPLSAQQLTVHLIPCLPSVANGTCRGTIPQHCASKFRPSSVAQRRQAGPIRATASRPKCRSHLMLTFQLPSAAGGGCGNLGLGKVDLGMAMPQMPFLPRFRHARRTGEWPIPVSARKCAEDLALWAGFVWLPAPIQARHTREPRRYTSGASV